MPGVGGEPAGDELGGLGGLDASAVPLQVRGKAVPELALLGGADPGEAVRVGAGRDELPPKVRRSTMAKAGSRSGSWTSFRVGEARSSSTR